MNPQEAFQDDKATQTFSDNLSAQLSQLPNQPPSLPPSFITSFVRRCFASKLVQVDFPQALTGLDYLKDLETRRRREVANAMNRLDIDRDILDSDADLLSSRFPRVVQWVKSIEEKERKIDALYTQLYIGLRRWILINELSLLPFNKHNSVAMLNTLYPPVTSAQPTSKLTPAILRNQRDGYFKYIQSVEKSGPRILGTLMQQGKGFGDENGWSAVTRTLGMYLQLANSIINDCTQVVDLQSVSPRKNSDTTTTRQPRKVDSGVSFNVSEGASSRSNSIVEPNSPTEPARPKTPSGIRFPESTRPNTPSGGKHGTALERIARGLKTIGRSRTVTEMIIDDATPPAAPEKPKMIRKMKSMGAIEGRNGSKSDVSSSTAPAFDADEMRRQRMKFEAGVVSAQKYGGNQSHEI